MGRKKNQVISAFTRIISKKISPCRILLFGSRVSGKPRIDSDYDFLLISPQFKKWEWEERASRIYHLKWGIPAAIDIICLTPEEFEQKKNQIGIVREAVKKGIEIVAH